MRSVHHQRQDADRVASLRTPPGSAIAARRQSDASRSRTTQTTGRTRRCESAPERVPYRPIAGKILEPIDFRHVVHGKLAAGVLGTYRPRAVVTHSIAGLPTTVQTASNKPAHVNSSSPTGCAVFLLLIHGIRTPSMLPKRNIRRPTARWLTPPLACPPSAFRLPPSPSAFPLPPLP